MGTLRTEPLRPRPEHVVVYEDPNPPDQWMTTRVVGTSAKIELGAGALAALAAIVGLAGELPIYMSMIAAILIGIGLIARAGAIGARWRKIAHHTPGSAETRSGTALEMLAGLVSVALAIIAPSTSEPATLIGCAVLVIGIALMLAGPEQTALGELAPSPVGRQLVVTRELMKTSTSAMVIIGLGAAVLGMLSILAGNVDMTLALVGLLGLGLGLLFAGAALAQRMIRRLA